MVERVTEGISHVFSGETSTKTNHRASVVHNGALAVGIGALLAWFLMMFTSLTAYVSSFDGPEPALNRAYFVQATIFVILCFVACRFTQSFAGVVQSKVVGLPTAVLLGIGSLILSYSGIDETIMPLLLGVGALLTGGAAVVLYGMLGERFGEIPYRDRLVYSLVGFALTSVLFTIFANFTGRPAALFAAGVAVLSGVGLLVADKVPASVVVEETIEPEHISYAGQRHLLLRFILMVFIWRLIVEWTRNMLIRGGVNEAGTTMFTRINALAALLVVTFVLVLIVFMAMRPRHFKLSYVYRVLLLTSLCAIVLTQVAFDPVSKVVPYALNSGVTNLLLMIIWAGTTLLVGFVPERPKFSVVLMIVGSAHAGAGVGFLLGVAFDMFLPHEPIVFSIVETVAVCGLVLVYLSVFTERDVDFLFRIVPTGTQRRFITRCEELARENGLSARETEILVLLAKGRNAAYIQDELCISYNTATTHRKRIYQKLGVHSQQELMSLVEEQE